MRQKTTRSCNHGGGGKNSENAPKSLTEGFLVTERKAAYSYIMHNVKVRPRVCCGRRWAAEALFFVGRFAWPLSLWKECDKRMILILTVNYIA
jgi:hypothetical protein